MYILPEILVRMETTFTILCLDTYIIVTFVHTYVYVGKHMYVRTASQGGYSYVLHSLLLYVVWSCLFDKNGIVNPGENPPNARQLDNNDNIRIGICDKARITVDIHTVYDLTFAVFAD